MGKFDHLMVDSKDWSPEVKRAVAQDYSKTQAERAKMKGYNPEWRARRTLNGKNYNGGKYESPYMEDNYGKAALMALFISLFFVFLVA